MSRVRKGRSWLNRLDVVARRLSHRAPRLFERMQTGTFTHEEIMDAVLAEFQRDQLQVQLLETKLKLKNSEMELASARQQLLQQDCCSDTANSSPNSSIDQLPCSGCASSSRIPCADEPTPSEASAQLESSSSSMHSDLLNLLAFAVGPSFADASPTASTRSDLSCVGGGLHRDSFMGSDASFVVLDSALRVIDCNDAFVRLLREGHRPVRDSDSDQRKVWSAMRQKPLYRELLNPPHPQCFDCQLRAMDRAVQCGSADLSGLRFVENQLVLDLSMWATYKSGQMRQPEYICILVHTVRRIANALQAGPRISDPVHPNQSSDSHSSNALPVPHLSTHPANQL